MRTSILIASHNEGNRILRTVTSCLDVAADFEHELIVVDDASTDGSIDDLESRCRDVKIIRHRSRRGPAATKHAAALRASGDVLLFVDGHCKPEIGSLLQLVTDVEASLGRAIVTPRLVSLNATTWQNQDGWVGHGFGMDLESLACGWIGLDDMKLYSNGPTKLYCSPTLVGCCLAIDQRLYRTLLGFDKFMRSWGCEDVDLGLKAWLMGYAVVHNPNATVGHHFRSSFDNYDVPQHHLLANHMRMAYKHFCDFVWEDWIERTASRIQHEVECGANSPWVWTRALNSFERDRPSLVHERNYMMRNRIRDEFWFAAEFDGHC